MLSTKLTLLKNPYIRVLQASNIHALNGRSIMQSTGLGPLPVLDFFGMRCDTPKIKDSEEDMMFGFGMPELIIILVIVLVVFGAGRLPEIGGALGKSIRNFKKASDGKDEIEIKPKSGDDDKKV
jgi:sec-independent protein translocase protein TatA